MNSAILNLPAEINVTAKFVSFLKFFWIHLIFTIAQTVFKQGFAIHRIVP